MDNPIITLIFNICVQLLTIIGNLLGLTYREINILIFCVLEPIAFIIMLIIIVKQHQNLKNLKK